MKAFYFLLTVVVYQMSYAFGQTLTPVGSGGFDFWPLVIIAVIGGIGYGLFIWHKRNPSSADAAGAAAKADIVAGWHKTTEQVGKLTDLARQQAIVIASPPVQAVINAPAPATVTPAPLFVPAPPVAVAPPPPPPIAPQPTIAPMPVQAPPAPVDVAPAPVFAPVPIPIVQPAPAPVAVSAPVGPETFGLTQKDIQAGAHGGYMSAKYQANLAACGGDQAKLNILQNWFQEGGGGYRPDQDERYLTDPNANMTAYGLAWNGTRWA